jgi:hypothetical protein
MTPERKKAARTAKRTAPASAAAEAVSLKSELC